MLTLLCYFCCMILSDLFIDPTEKALALDDIHLSKKNRDALNQLLKEFAHVELLSKYELPVDNKILLFGQSGCGKTSTARAIAAALHKDIFILKLSTIIDSRLGQTAKNIDDVFKKAKREKAVLFLDEFDYLGKLRDYDTKDSGEMKRLVNAIIQQIDHLASDCLLIAATNHSAIIDTALLRRFQLQLRFEMPTDTELDKYYASLLNTFPAAYRAVERAYNISFAQAKDITLRAVKNNIILEAEEQ